MQNPAPDIHIIGHWTYPANTVKTVYVAANHCDLVTLFVNGKQIGTANAPCDFVDPFDGKNNGNTGYIYAFPSVKFEPGVIRAVGMAKGRAVAVGEIKTAGAPSGIRLTVRTGPSGLQADGSDVALIDFEVVDALGNRCPTDEGRVDFTLDGPGIWRGGYNSGVPGSVNKLFLSTECGVNRVAIRSTLSPGAITLTAARPGLKSAAVKIESKPVAIQDGLVAVH
jgi:beta-galactosidase